MKCILQPKEGLRFSFFIFFFWLHGVFTAVLGLSRLQKVETTVQLWPTAAHRCGLSCCGARTPRLQYFGPRAPHSLWNLPKPGMEPRSPALAGGFLTAGPPRKSQFFKNICYLFGCPRSSLQHAGSFVVACKELVAACGIQFPDQGLNLGPLLWQHRVLATGPPGKCPKYLVLESNDQIYFRRFELQVCPISK